MDPKDNGKKERRIHLPLNEDAQKQIDEAKTRILNHATAIYNELSPGSTVLVEMPLGGKIEIPGKPREYGKLIIHKPTFTDRILGVVK